LKILVTGGAGFIGSHFVRSQLLQDSNWSEIVVLDALTYAGNLENLDSVLENPRLRFIQGDINDVSLVHSITDGVNTIVNFAAESHVDKSIESGAEFIRSNVLGTHVLLESALRNDVERYIQISTDEVYGSIDIGSWDEKEVLNPNSPYSASKASADLIALSYFRTHGLDIRITRCSNNYGSYQHPEKMIPASIIRLVQGAKILIYGNGQNQRDWLHVSDHCRAIDMVIENGQAGEIYNVGGGTELNNIQLAQLLLRISNKGQEFIQFVEDRKGHDKRYSVDYSKLTNLTGFSPVVDFEAGLQETFQWYLDNRNYWSQVVKNQK
jgi:dTDP-glucose 4,6-dehydratase